MPVSGEVKTIYSDAAKQNAVFPRTKVNAITDNSNASLSSLLNAKQDALVSGTNIKTINGTTLLGSGNVEVTAQLPTVSTQGNWYYKIYSDGYFEAWYGATGQTFTVTSASGSLYRSDLQTLTLPSNLTSQGTTDIISFNFGVGHNNYPVFPAVASKTSTAVNFYVLSGSSRTQNSNYAVSAYIFGSISIN